MPRAVTIGDPHVCPQFDGAKPHVGGPVQGPGAKSVLIDGKPAAVAGDKLVCASPSLDSIQQGVASVLIEGQPAAQGDAATAHGGKVIASSNVYIG